MVTGIEGIGLALAVIPVVVEVIEGYGAVASSRDARFLADSLKNQERIFLNSVEILLRSIFSSAEVRTLLDDLRGSSWSNDRLNERVVDHLGDEASGILETVDGIYSTVLQLKDKLPVSHSFPSAAYRSIDGLDQDTTTEWTEGLEPDFTREASHERLCPGSTLPHQPCTIEVTHH